MKALQTQFQAQGLVLPTSFISFKKDSPNIDAEMKEVKIRFGNLNYGSIIWASLYLSCSTRADIMYAFNKLAKFLNNPQTTHFRALLYLNGYIKRN